jgi:mRNA-degrading endonuclease HigB of HigAB toxin-antitoxin module
MRVIALSTLKAFWDSTPAYRDAREPGLAWYRTACRADWVTPADVKADFRNASILKEGRVVFNLAGNKYRCKASGAFEFLGFEFRWGRGRWGKPVIKRRTARKKYRVALASFQDWCRKHCRVPKAVLFLQNRLLKCHSVKARFRKIEGEVCKMMIRILVYICACILVIFLSSCDIPKTVSNGFTHISSKNGDIPEPGPSPQQTASLILDVDRDGINDFIIGSRVTGPSVLWYQRNATGWTKYIIDNTFLPIEAGGSFYDIDGDGDLDIVFGADHHDNKVWWWENPYPLYDPEKPWKRRIIKDAGVNKHHDQIFGDFDQDGMAELVFWNQKANKLFIADIPSDPKNTQPWPYSAIFSSSSQSEGLAKIDMDGDGKIDIVGGGRWFKHDGAMSYIPNIIDDEQRFSRVAVGQLKEGGWPEVVFVVGDGVGRLKWYEWKGNSWASHDLLGFDVDHGHSLEIADFNNDGKMDIFCGEMRLSSGRIRKRNIDAKLWIFLGNGKGNFIKKVIAEGFGVHEAKVADLDGDGDIDILGKPYNWETPRLDVWLNNMMVDGKLSLKRWKRNVVDSRKPWRSVFISAADMDSDGRKDIITGGWWYKNPGAVTEKWIRTFIGAPLNNMAAVFDFDGDGKQDVLGTQGKGSKANSSFAWAKNDGAGSFAILKNIMPGDGDFLQGVAIAPFQNENYNEIALSWHVADKGIQMLTVPSQPSVEKWPHRIISDISQDECLSAGDIDLDGDMDLLLGTKWLRNDGASWSAFTLNNASGLPDRNRLIDINTDARLDAVVGYESNKLAWYEQGSTATLLWAEHIIATDIVRPMSVDVADMDKDGDIDIIVGEHNLKTPSEARLYILENKDGKGNNWLKHLIHTGDEHHDGARIVDIDDDGDYDIISIGWSHKRVLLYENKAIDF